jgi:NADH dehydrogenase (ubiquinone) Fe-S protein 4
MQSAKGKTKKWILDWDILQGAGRWENPLMGWASSADYMQGTNMAFRSREDAVAFVSYLPDEVVYLVLSIVDTC